MHKKFLLYLVLLISFSTFSFGFSKYVIGYRYYIRYVKHIPKYGIKTPDLLKKLNIKNQQQLIDLFKNNGQPLIEKVKKFNPAVANGLEKIIQKGKLEELKTFMIAVYNGKIPPGCGM